MCGDCGVRKEQSAFSQTQWKRVVMGPLLLLNLVVAAATNAYETVRENVGEAFRTEHARAVARRVRVDCVGAVEESPGYREGASSVPMKGLTGVIAMLRFYLSVKRRQPSTGHRMRGRSGSTARSDTDSDGDTDVVVETTVSAPSTVSFAKALSIALLICAIAAALLMGTGRTVFALPLVPFASAMAAVAFAPVAVLSIAGRVRGMGWITGGGGVHGTWKLVCERVLFSEINQVVRFS